VKAKLVFICGDGNFAGILGFFGFLAGAIYYEDERCQEKQINEVAFHKLDL
jgi:hypothetical protein